MRTTVKVLLFFDVGGSMDDHVRVCEELFSAARAEFRHLAAFYFHNCVYEGLWRDNRRRWDAQIPTDEVLRLHGAEYRLVIVGDATMSPHEVVHAGGAVEHWNREPGTVWMQRLLDRFPNAVWINPQPEDWWDRYPSIGMLRHIMGGRMFPLTLDGLDRAVKML